MHHNQTDSTFKMPIAPQPPPSQAETLLFNDILEEKTLALRNTLNEFLQVQPYRKFDIEFSNFLKRTKRIIQEGQRTGANISRITNSSQIAPVYARPSASFSNYRPLTPMSMASSSTSNRNSMLRISQNSFQPIEPVNPFKPPMNIGFEPRVLLPRIDQSPCARRSPSYATVIEVNQVENETARINNVHLNYQQSEPEKQPVSAVALAPNSYSDVTLIDNRSASSSQQNPEFDENNDNSNSIESLLEGVGFKILVGLPENSQNTKISNASNLQNQLNLKENAEKYLSTWSVNIKILKTKLKTSKAVLLLTGTLLERDKITIIEKRHDAGYLESRKENNLVKTNNGLYRLIGNIVSGHPNELYQKCLAMEGIPRTWKQNVKQLSGIDKININTLLNFSLDSPAGPGPSKQKKNSVEPKPSKQKKKYVEPEPSKQKKNYVEPGPTKQNKNSLLDMSMTRNGTTYSKRTNIVDQKTTGKRKISENDVHENSKSKHRKFHEKIPPLLASTPKRPKKPPIMFETPSQILKNKILQNMRTKTRVKSDSRTMNSVNDSIQVTKQRQSNSSKEQTNLFLKPKEPTKTSLSSNNSTKVSRRSEENSSLKSIHKNQSIQTSKNKNQSKLTSISKSSILNYSMNSRSKSKTSENSTVITNNSKLRCSLISSSNSPLNSLKKSKPKISPEDTVSTKVVKVTKLSQLSKCVKKRDSSSRMSPNNSKEVKVVNIKKTKDCSNIYKNKKFQLEKSKAKPMKKQCSSSAELGLFDNMEDDADYCNVSDFNILASPGKVSLISRTDKSRSETPPLFNHQWSTSGKSLIFSEPPTPLCKSAEAKALKRVKAPKLTLEEKIKNNKGKGKNNKQSVDYDTVSKKIDQMLEFGEQYDDDDD